MHAGADAHALEEAFSRAKRSRMAREHRHVAVGPEYAGQALVGQVDVQNIAGLAHGLLPFVTFVSPGRMTSGECARANRVAQHPCPHGAVSGTSPQAGQSRRRILAETRPLQVS